MNSKNIVAICLGNLRWNQIVYVSIKFMTGTNLLISVCYLKQFHTFKQLLIQEAMSLTQVGLVGKTAARFGVQKIPNRMSVAKVRYFYFY